MNKPCARITLDLQQASTPTFVAVKKSDIGREIRITLSDGGFPYEISADCYAVLTGTKPDGNILYNHCDIEGNTIVYEITEQTTAAAGRMKAEVKLYGADDILVTSATFRIIIDGTVYTDDQVESSSEFSALTQLMSQVLEIIKNNSGESGGGISITIVNELPTEDISTSTLYLVKDTDAQSNIYTEYLYVNGSWEIIGSQSLDLTGYIKTINGEGPDENGDIKIVLPDSGGYATEKYVQTYAQPKGDYLKSTELSDAINTALAQAKESGQFDGKNGYTPVKGKDYFDGVSPTVAVSKTGKITTITITDVNGTKTATINDGKDGTSSGGNTVPIYYTSKEPSDDMNLFLFIYSEIETNGRTISAGDWIVTPSGRVYVVDIAEDYGIDATYDASLSVDSSDPDNVDLGIIGATVGQIAKIIAVDEEGRPTAWESVNLPDSGGNVDQGTGWTSEQIEILDSIGDHINFLDAEGGRLWDSLIAALTSGQSTSAVLTSITAVYSGGSVEAGTATSDLTFTVTATYDDGTSKTVTGYTLSPSTISEGENTVTVTYNGKTSTFTVTGIVTPAEVVLESISAVFNGETAQAGTNASDLDITVTGHYSDGSTKTETSWTTAGSVIEGENVFTIYLNDKTCTVSVVGVAVEEEPTDACYTKIATVPGQANDTEYGMVQLDSSLVENNKLYALVLDPRTVLSEYKPFLLSIFYRNWDGTLYASIGIGNGGKDFNGWSKVAVNFSETDGVITVPGGHYGRFKTDFSYNLYEIGNDTQVFTDGQFFDYIGTIAPTQGEAMTNTLTIPASAFTDTGLYAVFLRSWNTELDYVANSTYKWTPKSFAGFGNALPGTQNEDGSATVGENNYRKFAAECNLAYDVYRVNPIWG